MRNTRLYSSVQGTKLDGTALRQSLYERFRGSILALVAEVLEEEVQALCGHLHARKPNRSIHRNGSDPASIVLSGQKIKIRKPRIKQNKIERPLQNYKALQNKELMDETICKHMMSGVSTRDYADLVEHIAETTGISKSAVSRSFNRSSRQALDEVNGASLSDYKPCAMMLDGIHFGGSACMVAMGIDAQGCKRILGLREGATENSTVVSDLLQNLEARGLSTSQPTLFIVDGSKALKKAIVKVFGKRALIQRCIHHKKRNILRYLPDTRHREFSRRWKLVHETLCAKTAACEYAKLLEWLKGINCSAYQSLLESNEETLTVTRLGLRAPLLRKTLQSTNPLESMFSFAASRLKRVTHWQTQTDQVLRWVAAAGVRAQKRAKRVPGHLHLPAFVEILHTHYNKLAFKENAA